MTPEAIVERLPFLKTAGSAFRETFFAHAIVTTVPAGGAICLEDNQCAHLPIALSGTARVYKVSEEGKELTLYRVEPGESCILTASCILNQQAFPANAVALTDMEAIVVPATDVNQWMHEYHDWRQYIFQLIARRLGNVIELVEEVAFQRMDVRLATYLYDESASGDKIRRTHESIATDLGTSREVVSRLLKELEQQNIIALSRGEIQVLKRSKLTRNQRETRNMKPETKQKNL